LWTFFCSALPVLPQESRSGAKSLRKKSLTLMQQTDNERKENLPGIAVPTSKTETFCRLWDDNGGYCTRLPAPARNAGSS
ncbi:MAG: hypothetical protein OXC26_00125, partial [Albidovulum sp.]|nr:hypothetical protein [Albidovulum sp.]